MEETIRLQRVFELGADSGPIGFTGTRTGMTAIQKKLVRARLVETKPSVAHHGDGILADKEFDEICKELKIPTVTHPSNLPEKYQAHCTGYLLTFPPKDPLVRDMDIVKAVTELIACPPGEEENYPRSGTWATVRRARDIVLVAVSLYMPDGSFEIY